MIDWLRDRVATLTPTAKAIQNAPPTAAATTGVPVAWASTATSPKDSL